MQWIKMAPDVCLWSTADQTLMCVVDGQSKNRISLPGGPRHMPRAQR